MLGYSRDEFVGQRIADLKIHAGSAQREAIWDAIRQQGGIPSYETRWRTKSGQLLDIISAAAIIDLDGVPCLLGMGVEVTQLKQAERDLRDKERMEIELRKERELGEIKRRFMITAAHEFRTPLAIILASSEMVEMYTDRISPERRAESFATVRSQVMSLGEMLDDMRMILDIEGGGVTFDPAPQDMTRLCRIYVDEIQSSLGSRHRLVFDCADDCPAVPLDSALFERVVKSLLSNAIKFSPQGGEVHVSVKYRENAAILTISDDGIGIPAVDHPRIFEPYHRSANALNIPGIGLGLAIVRNFVALHDGQVTFTSEEGKGATFVVSLPAR
jgi:signal transduction histidine kinase